MNEKIIIGKKATRKNIFTNFIAFTFYGLIGGIGTFGILKFLTNLNNGICAILGVIAFFITMFIVVPLAAITDYIEVNKTSIIDYSFHGYLQMLSETCSLIAGKKTAPTCQIYLEKINSVEISYEPFQMLWAQKGYKIKLQFNLNDSSSIVIYPSGHNNIKNNDYEKMFILLENKYIPIIDKHNLRPILKTNPNNLNNYIESLKKDTY